MLSFGEVLLLWKGRRTGGRGGIVLSFPFETRDFLSQKVHGEVVDGRVELGWVVEEGGREWGI